MIHIIQTHVGTTWDNHMLGIPNQYSSSRVEKSAIWCVSLVLSQSLKRYAITSHYRNLVGLTSCPEVPKPLIHTAKKSRVGLAFAQHVNGVLVEITDIPTWERTRTTKQLWLCTGTVCFELRSPDTDSNSVPHGWWLDAGFWRKARALFRSLEPVCLPPTCAKWGAKTSICCCSI